MWRSTNCLHLLIMEGIWKQTASIYELNNSGKGTMGEWLGFEFKEIGSDYLIATLPVDHRTKQPYGILHGGASVVLAETLGSVASNLCISENKRAVGLEVNANHLRPVMSGFVTGICKPLAIGSKVHVWEIRITNEKEKLSCICRLTVAIIDAEDLKKV